MNGSLQVVRNDPSQAGGQRPRRATNRQSGAPTIAAPSAGAARRPVTIGVTRLSRLTSQIIEDRGDVQDDEAEQDLEDRLVAVGEGAGAFVADRCESGPVLSPSSSLANRPSPTWTASSSSIATHAPAAERIVAERRPAAGRADSATPRRPAHETGEARGRAADHAPDQPEQDQAEHDLAEQDMEIDADRSRCVHQNAGTAGRSPSGTAGSADPRSRTPPRSMLGRPIGRRGNWRRHGRPAARRRGSRRCRRAAPPRRARAPRPAALRRRAGKPAWSVQISGSARVRTPASGPGAAREPAQQLRREADDDVAPCADRVDRRRAAVQLVVDPLHRAAHLLVIAPGARGSCRRAPRSGAAVVTMAAMAAAARRSASTVCSPEVRMSIASAPVPDKRESAAAKKNAPAKGAAGAFPRNPVRRYATGRTRKLACQAFCADVA